MGNVTIIEPAIDQSECPEWAKKAFDEGHFFKTAVNRVEELEAQLAKRSILQRITAWIDRQFPNR
jgi:hypothetical protein